MNKLAIILIITGLILIVPIMYLIYHSNTTTITTNTVVNGVTTNTETITVRGKTVSCR